MGEDLDLEEGSVISQWVVSNCIVQHLIFLCLLIIITIYAHYCIFYFIFDY